MTTFENTIKFLFYSTFVFMIIFCRKGFFKEQNQGKRNECGEPLPFGYDQSYKIQSKMLSKIDLSTTDVSKVFENSKTLLITYTLYLD